MGAMVNHWAQRAGRPCAPPLQPPPGPERLAEVALEQPLRLGAPGRFDIRVTGLTQDDGALIVKIDTTGL
ncbi:hypothetical protein ACWD25_07650 [Streptomyces sp. NPDC002920]